MYTQLLQKFTFSLGLLIFAQITSVFTTPRNFPSYEYNKQFRSTNTDEDDEVKTIMAALDPRIIGGRPARDGEAPYQLSLWRFSIQVCGATLVISPTSGMQIGITAAHCVCKGGTNELLDINEHIIRGGDTHKWSGQKRDIRKFARHESYDGTFFHDIGIIFIDGSFELNTYMQPISLPDPEVDYDSIETLTVSGWGYLKEEGETVTWLEIVDLPVIDNKKCADLYVKYYAQQKVIMETSMCAGEADGGKDSCKGDSGGPAIAKGPNGKFLAAVVSWGKGCARADAPGVYMRVGPYLDWIAKQTSDDEKKSELEREREEYDYYTFGG